jgi:hypothetical protein
LGKVDDTRSSSDKKGCFMAIEVWLGATGRWNVHRFLENQLSASRGGAITSESDTCPSCMAVIYRHSQPVQVA